MRENLLIITTLLLTLVACGNQSSTASDEHPTTQPEEVVTTPDEVVVATGDASKADNIVISKQSMSLTLYDSNGDVVCRFPVAVGKHMGNKQRPGDMKTPEGEFTIEQIQNAASWVHDFGDGKGIIEGCYGNWFIRLKTPPHRGIGIHGTHDPASIGTRATEGCIRLNNNDLDSLKPMVHVGMVVRIESSDEDRRADGIEVETMALEHDNNPEEVMVETTAEPAAAPTGETAQATAPQRDEASTDETSSGDVWHTVVDGDLVGRIAQRYGTTTSEIKRLNPGINIDRISIGQRIRVAGDSGVEAATEEVVTAQQETPAPESSAEEEWYVVQDGDLVGRIAQRYGTTSKRIAELNPDINIDRISIGQRIRIR